MYQNRQDPDVEEIINKAKGFGKKFGKVPIIIGAGKGIWKKVW